MWETAVFAAGLMLLVALGGSSPAAAQQQAARGIDGACPVAAQQFDRFTDVEPGTHFETVNCLAFYEITRGHTSTSDGRFFAPQEPVTRGQMATFTVRMIELVRGEELPIDARFDDDAVVHQTNIRKLATAGVVQGLGDGTFAPRREVTRAQMATFVAQAIELLIGAELSGENPFDDVDGTHAASVGGLATNAVVTGYPDGTYRPGQAITREQMAAFLARGMDLVAERGAFPDFVQPVDGVPSTGLWETDATDGVKAITDVRAGAHDRFDRLVLELSGEGEAGWRIGYVDEARSPSSGELIEVDGEAILAVLITGVTAPADLPEDIETWLVERLEGDGDVITEVVNASVSGGRHTFYVGVSGERPLVVERVADPQRIVIDVFADFTPLPPPEIEPPPPDPEVVSTFTTQFAAAGQPRNTNIQLAADYIDGDVIPAGGTYSLNQGIGERTTERGFVGNGFIDHDGEIISVVGGGVSQMGTTFLNAAWFAGIQLDGFRQHTIYFDRYPMCHEATLIWDVLDVVVTNDSPHDITIVTDYTETAVTVSFVSVPWAEVTSWTGQPYNIDGGIGGAFSVNCGRTVTYPDATTSTQDYSWRYNEGYPG